MFTVTLVYDFSLPLQNIQSHIEYEELAYPENSMHFVLFFFNAQFVGLRRNYIMDSKVLAQAGHICRLITFRVFGVNDRVL